MGYESVLRIEDLHISNKLIYTKSFTQQVTDDVDFLPMKELLTEDERYLINPYVPEDYENIPTVDSKQLYDVFKKVYNYIKDNQDILPLIHEMKEIGKSDILFHDEAHFKEGDFDYHLDGDTVKFCLERKHIFKTYNKEFHEYYKHCLFYSIRGKNNSSYQSEYIKVEPIMKFASKTFETRTLTKYQEFKEYFDEIFSILEEAIRNNKNVYWYKA